MQDLAVPVVQQPVQQRPETLVHLDELEEPQVRTPTRT